MDKKKMFFPIVFIIILLLMLLPGCISEEKIPVSTSYAKVDWDRESVFLYGRFSYPFCKASSAMFVYDTEPHKNWEDYQFSINARISVTHPGIFTAGIPDDQVQHYVTYYFRAVAYCYDFKGPLRNYEEGYYAGNELTFYVYY